MFKKGQLLKIKREESFLNNPNYSMTRDGIINKQSKVLLNTAMVQLDKITAPVTTTSRSFIAYGWTWFDWMFEESENINYLFDIE